MMLNNIALSFFCLLLSVHQLIQSCYTCLLARYVGACYHCALRALDKRASLCAGAQLTKSPGGGGEGSQEGSKQPVPSLTPHRKPAHRTAALRSSWSHPTSVSIVPSLICILSAQMYSLHITTTALRLRRCRTLLLSRYSLLSVGIVSAPQRCIWLLCDAFCAHCHNVPVLQ